MTTLLTITTAVLAVCAAALGWRCVRLRKYASEVEAQRIDIWKSLDNADCSYVIGTATDGSVAVFKRSESQIGVTYILIKTFTDEDASFNQREAEELLDKLKEK